MLDLSIGRGPKTRCNPGSGPLVSVMFSRTGATIPVAYFASRRDAATWGRLSETPSGAAQCRSGDRRARLRSPLDWPWRDDESARPAVAGICGGLGASTHPTLRILANSATGTLYIPAERRAPSPFPFTFFLLFRIWLQCFQDCRLIVNGDVRSAKYEVRFKI
jgi:hypothetical protein